MKKMNTLAEHIAELEETLNLMTANGHFADEKLNAAGKMLDDVIALLWKRQRELSSSLNIEKDNEGVAI